MEKELTAQNVKDDSLWGPLYKAAKNASERKHIVAAATKEYKALS
jgi:hypothetical protein